jgi:hypothetical protein
MILDLTIENLLKSGCNEAEANKLYNCETDYNLQCNNGSFYVSKLENKFYTEIDYQRKKYFGSGNIAFPLECPDLIPDYFDLALNDFLLYEKGVLKSMFVEADQKAIFISRQIKAVKNEIDITKQKISKVPNFHFLHQKNSIFNSYLEFLKRKEIETTKPTHETEVLDLNNTNSDFNLNEFNEVTYNLFIYLIGNYQKKGKVKYVNIYRFLKNINKVNYAFNFTQKTYKEYIYKNFEVELTTFNTANFEFDDKEKPILSGFEQAFRNIKP